MNQENHQRHNADCTLILRNMKKSDGSGLSTHDKIKRPITQVDARKYQESTKSARENTK